MSGRRPCGMCGHLCWRCRDEFDRAKAELDRLESEWASLRLALAEAGDSDAPVISDELSEVEDAMNETVGALTAMEEGSGADVRPAR